jgi:uncharacterized BrkB/YihY/UPF0761 family membrane protein
MVKMKLSKILTKETRHLLERKQGQMTIIAIVMTLVGILVYAGLQSTINDAVNDVYSGSNTTYGQTERNLIKLIPGMIVLGIFLALIWYIIPKYQGGGV